MVILLVTSLSYDYLRVFAFTTPPGSKLAKQCADEEQTGKGQKKFTAAVLLYFLKFHELKLSSKKIVIKIIAKITCVPCFRYIHLEF